MIQSDEKTLKRAAISDEEAAQAAGGIGNRIAEEEKIDLPVRCPKCGIVGHTAENCPYVKTV